MAKMPAKTLKALKGSIAKWEAIVAGTGEDQARDNCPLCHLFYKNRASRSHCEGCPVKLKTGQPYCWETPYTAWSPAMIGRVVADTPELVALAQAELDFLKSLLPEEA